MQPTTDLSSLLDRLAGFEPTRYPFVSLYLNAQADQHGRDRHQTFVERELGERAETYIDDAEARGSLSRDLDRIQRFLMDELMPSANSAAIFACAGGLGVVGFERTRQALENGQVDELLVSASLAELRGVHGIEPALMEAEADDAGTEEPIEKVDAALRADEIVAKARLTDAKITFIEDASLLAPVGGVGAFLRFKIGGSMKTWTRR